MTLHSKKLYELTIGESFNDESNGYFITRVPGGWIYQARHQNPSYDSPNLTALVFVPYVEPQ